MNIHLLWWCGCVEFVFIGGHFEFCSQQVSISRSGAKKSLDSLLTFDEVKHVGLSHPKGNIFKKIKIAHFDDVWKVVFIWRSFWISRSAGVRPGAHYWGEVFGRSDGFPSRYKRLRRFLVSYLTPADRWIQNEHEYCSQILCESPQGIMYRSNRSFNMPPPPAYPGHLTLLPSRGGGNLIIRVFQGVGNLIPIL